MNRKTVIYWLLIFCSLTYYFFSYASFLFDAQEEAQLFISQWRVIGPQLCTLGGVCRVLGMFGTQFYCFPLIAALINGFLLTGIGIGCYLLFQRTAARGYHLFLALFPVLILLKAHIQSNYVPDSTLALFFMLFVLSGVFSFRAGKTRLAANIAGTLFIYWTSGLLVLLYAVLSVALAFIFRNDRDRLLYKTVPFAVALFLAFIGIRYSLLTPLTEGLNGQSYHEMQLQPDSYIYYVWIIFCTAFLFLIITAKTLSLIRPEKKRVKIALTTGVITGVVLFSGFFLPNVYDARNRMMDQLSYLSRRQKWDVIIQLHSGKKISNTINRNYLNMALAQKGMLGDRLFHFDQHGPAGLLASYNGSYYMSVLLSDIHFVIGDISLSESYAMEGLTLARRGGSPRMLQRLIQISLIRQEWELARKYIAILKETPVYRKWAIRHEAYIAHPEKMADEPALNNQYFSSQVHDELFCLLDIHTIWSEHLNGKRPNRTAFEYLGCSLLLAKETELFKDFLLKTMHSPIAQPLPLHFQEAALIVFADNPEILRAISLDASVAQNYNGYVRLSKQMQNQPGGAENMHNQYGNTYWFYYQYKNTGK